MSTTVDEVIHQSSITETSEQWRATMASLWWRWSEYTLSDAAEDIGEVYDGITEGLTSLGYTGVQHAEDVHGCKGDFILAVVYLYISGQNFWQVMACGGSGTESEAQTELSEVQNMINKLTFL
jgi:hypothetical protein